ncbi:MAG TPA: extracellular solute-binding protein, partial [Planctomycetota bacterium]|nr:extracellular solute-binding protein [Planctomycetota bacterium]
MGKRVATTCLCVLAALALRPAPLPAQTPSLADVGNPEPVTLSVWSLPRPESTGIQAKCDRAVLRAFRDYYRRETGRGIRLISPTGIAIPEVGEMDTRPLMAIAGGVSPDVIYVNFRQSDTYIQEGFLYPLDRWVKPLIEKQPDEWRERVPEQVEKVICRWGPGTKTGDDPDRHYWAMPYGIYIKGLIWRKDLFKAVGLDPDRPPKTWDESYDFARRCTDPVTGTYGIFMPPNGWYFYSLLVSAGARVMQDKGEDDWEVCFNSPEAVEAYAFMLKLEQGKWRHASGKIVEGVVYSESQGASLLWNQGRIAMQEQYFVDDKLADINPELVGIAPVPAHPTRGRASELNCTMCGIFSGAADKGPEVLEAAWHYVYFIGSPMAKEIRTRVMVENGYGMFANPVYLERLGYDDYLRRIPPEWRQVFEEALRSGEPEPYGRNCQQVYKFMTDPAEKMLLEGVGYREFDAAEAARERILREDPDITAEALESQLDEVRRTTQREVREEIKRTLDAAVNRANQVMIGNLPPDVMFRRRVIAWIVAGVIALAFALLFRYVWKVFKPPEAKGGWLFRKYWLAYLILIPAVGTIALWAYVPMVRG